MILIEENDDRFYMKESTIPNAGLGVFAKCPLKKGDYLEIIGVQVKRGSVVDKCTNYARSYKFAGKPGYEFDRYVIPMGYAAIINHAPNEQTQNCYIDANNLPKRDPTAGQLVYRFLKDIEADEEMFGNYGEQWDNLLEWASNETQTDHEWERFLSLDLYNLGLLRKRLGEACQR